MGGRRYNHAIRPEEGLPGFCSCIMFLINEVYNLLPDKKSRQGPAFMRVYV